MSSLSHLHSPHNASQPLFFLNAEFRRKFLRHFCMQIEARGRFISMIIHERKKSARRVVSEWCMCVCFWRAAVERERRATRVIKRAERVERAAHLVVMLTAAGLPLLWLTHGAVNNSSATFLIWIKQRVLPLSSVAVAGCCGSEAERNKSGPHHRAITTAPNKIDTF